MSTKLYHMPFYTQSADKITIVVEASNEQEALELAQAAAIDIGALEADEVDDPDAECFFGEPQEIEAATGQPGVRLQIS